MSISITLIQTNTVENQDDNTPLYVSRNVITASEGIELALFVHSVDTEAFSHVATSLDMASWPTSLAEAQSASVGFYRQVSAQRSYTSILDAQDFAQSIRTRLTTLARDYEDVQNLFIGETTTVFTGD